MHGLIIEIVGSNIGSETFLVCFGKSSNLNVTTLPVCFNGFLAIHEGPHYNISALYTPCAWTLFIDTPCQAST